jgi:LAS superfamily LD-carboxypeptidase LdcB
MAGNMDPNDIQGVAEAMEELRKNGTLSAEALAKLGGNSVSAGKALEGYTKAVLGAGSAVGGMARAIADGDGQFKSLGGTISGLAAAVNTVAGAFGSLGKVLGAISVAGAEVAKFVLDQMDVLQTNYRTLGDASAGAADGVDGLLRQFDALGNFSLPAFTKAVRANVNGLAAFRGTAALGAEELSKIAGALTTGDTAKRFIKLGMSLDAVGEITTEYLSNMSRYGLTQGQTTEELTEKTQNYIVEVDKIARLTGQTREAQQKEAQKNLADARYRAKISEMRSRGQVNEAKQLELFVRGLGAINPAFADAARATVTGTYLTKQAAEADIVLNGAIRRNINAIEQGTDAVTAIADTQDATGQAADQFRQLFKYGKDLGGMGVGVFDTEALLLRRKELERTGLTQAQAIAQAQKEQMEATGEITGKFVDATLKVADTSKNLQDLGFILVKAAIPAVEKFADILESATKEARDYFGIPDSRKTRGSGGPGVAPGPGAEQSGNLAGVNPQLATAVSKAMEDYKRLTGKDATITSGVRDREKQQRLYDAYIAGGKKGMPVAKPGTSLHETGNAVDINKTAANEMDRMGILSKYGLTRPVANDPVHVELAGPSGRYKSPMTGVGSPTSAGSETQTQGSKATGQQQTDSVNTRLIQRLEEMVALQRQNNNQNTQLLKNFRS